LTARLPKISPRTPPSFLFPLAGGCDHSGDAADLEPHLPSSFHPKNPTRPDLYSPFKTLHHNAGKGGKVFLSGLDGCPSDGYTLSDVPPELAIWSCLCHRLPNQPLNVESSPSLATSSISSLNVCPTRSSAVRFLHFPGTGLGRLSSSVHGSLTRLQGWCPRDLYMA